MSGSNNNNNNIQNLATMIALYKFEADAEPEISLKQHDQIEMLDMDPALNGWAYARRKRDNAEGYVPISYLGTINTNNNRSHKSSKSGNVNQSRSSSPNPNKSRFDDKNSGFNRNKGYGNNPNQRSYNQQNNNPQSNNYGNKGHNKGYGGNQDDGGNDAHSVNSSNNGMNQHQQQQHHHHNQHNQHQSQSSHSQHSNQTNQQNQGNQQNNKGDSNSNNNSDGNDGRQIICSFHRDFIPEMTDLYKYFGQFGKVTNKIEIEYDAKKVPLAKIRFQTSQCVDKVVNKGNRQQIPSGQQNGTIHIRVYRSMQDYINNTQRSNRGPYSKHKSNRRGAF